MLSLHPIRSPMTLNYTLWMLAGNLSFSPRGRLPHLWRSVQVFQLTLWCNGSRSLHINTKVLLMHSVVIHLTMWTSDRFSGVLKIFYGSQTFMSLKELLTYRTSTTDLFSESSIGDSLLPVSYFEQEKTWAVVFIMEEVLISVLCTFTMLTFNFHSTLKMWQATMWQVKM